MLKSPYRRLHAAHAQRTGGFTLVELLVVIGIIAILAGVALGPITGALKKAHESGAMQTTRTLAMAEFQAANDNDGAYPDGADSGAVAAALITGNYVSDPAIFRIQGDTIVTVPAAGAALVKANVSFDFCGLATAGNPLAGVDAAAPDQLPLVWSPDPGAILPAADNVGTAFVPAANGVFGKDGIAVCYKSNNAFFRAPQINANPLFPGKGKALFVDQTYASSAKGYIIRQGASGF
jgi:prepilin-type N-terminal cleavage/methylation domain-containing protein